MDSRLDSQLASTHAQRRVSCEATYEETKSKNEKSVIQKKGGSAEQESAIFPFLMLAFQIR